MSVVKVRLILDVAQGMVSGARVLDHRAWQVSSLLCHKTAAEAEKLAGMLLRLCAQAQTIALRVACAAARGADALALESTAVAHESNAPPADALALTLRCAMVRDHAWYLLLSLPQTCGLPTATSSLKALLEQDVPQALQLRLHALLQDTLLAMPPAQWLELSAAQFWRWYGAQQALGAILLDAMPQEPSAHTGQAEGCALLPGLAQLDEAQLLAWIRAIRRPLSPTQSLRWQGRPVQTGALARHWAHPLVGHWRESRGAGCGARVLARLVELAQLGQLLTTPFLPMVRAWNLESGQGLAAVETARGLLLHEAHWARGVIQRYKIISPTDWNLTAGGALSQALCGVPAERGSVERIAQSFDPCLEMNLEFVHA